MDGGSWHCIGGSDQDHPQEKEMHKGKMVVWGGLRGAKGKREKERYTHLNAEFQRSIPFLSFIEPICAWNVLLVSLIFLKRSLVFPILLFSSIYLLWSHRKAFLSLFAILWNSAFRWVYLSFSLLPLAPLRPPQTTILPLCISFSWGWSWSLPPVQCHKPLSIVLQALCLSDLIP